MDENLFEQLLYRDESESLDFKSQQYPFAGATDEAKSELLKDILALANSWRIEDGYILIGVQESQGGKSTPLGTTDHIPDHSLQQFVNTKLNRPIRFSYEVHSLNNMQIGIIRVQSVQRPVYLRSDFGRLKAGDVYVRRGSSTALADPDEVAAMGEAKSGPALGSPILSPQFGISRSQLLLGTNIRCHSPNINIPDEVPAYSSEPDQFFLSAMARFDNEDYFLEVAKYLEALLPLTPLSFVVHNGGPATADAVRLEFFLPRSDSLIILDEEGLPDIPSTSSITFAAHSATRISESRDVEIVRRESGHTIAATIERILPGQTAWTKDRIFIGCTQPSLNCEMRGSMYCSNTEPTDMEFRIEIVSDSEVDITEEILDMHGLHTLAEILPLSAPEKVDEVK